MSRSSDLVEMALMAGLGWEHEQPKGAFAVLHSSGAQGGRLDRRPFWWRTWTTGLPPIFLRQFGHDNQVLRPSRRSRGDTRMLFALLSQVCMFWPLQVPTLFPKMQTVFILPPPLGLVHWLIY